MKYIKLFENFENAKKNPDKIVIKFNDAGYDQFWNQYIKQTDDSTRGLGNNWVYFGSWEDLARPGNTHHDPKKNFSISDAKGLEMTDGEYYLLFKTYDKKEVDDWYKGGRREGMLSATFFFLNYSKDGGEIGIWSVYGTEYQHIESNKEYHDTKLKGYIKKNTYCRFDKTVRDFAEKEIRPYDLGKGGVYYRLVKPGAVDHRGYFKVIDVK